MQEKVSFLKLKLKRALRFITRPIPSGVKRMCIFCYLFVVDLFLQQHKKRIFGTQSKLIPPLRYMFDGPRNYKSFKENGDDFFVISKEKGGLLRTDAVLDIGCGIGRKTLPLLTYLDSQIGRYEGIDVRLRHVSWCKKKIEPIYQNFHFHFYDIWNKAYNPQGKIQAKDFKFPFENSTFDFVILGSVFTHMFAADVKHYIEEIGRVLKKGGRGYISHFLLNKESEQLIQEGISSINLSYPGDSGSKADNPDMLESAVGHSEELIRSFYNSQNIEVQINYGSWCGRKSFLSYQDILCLHKIS